MMRARLPRALRALLALAAAVTAGAAHAQAPRPPVARMVPHADTVHGEVREDPYRWLRDDTRKDSRVVAYLEAENAYAEAMTRHTAALRDSLVAEMRSRMKESDTSVPVRDGGWWYYSRTEAGKQYRVHARRPGSMSAPEQLVLDENALAAGHAYFDVGRREVSPDGRLLAFTVDTTGAERFVLQVKDLTTGRLLSDRIEGVDYNLEWAADSRTLLYGVSDSANRPHKIFRHRLGDAPARAAELVHEPDVTFDLNLSRTKDRQWLVATSSAYGSTEVKVLPAARPGEAFRTLLPRRAGEEHAVEHHGDRFLVRTNVGALNFRVVAIPEAGAPPARWTQIVPHDERALIEDVDVFRDHLVLYERGDALRRIRIVPLRGGAPHTIAFDEPVYVARPAANPEFDAGTLRFSFTSPVTPEEVWEYDMATRKRTLLKRTEVPNYDRARYRTAREWATASDGARIPITLLWRGEPARDGSRPAWLTAYGAYGSSRDPVFDANVLSLADRGVVVALAHIRGGQEMGRAWYDQGKLLNKKNSFTDFIAAAEHLGATGIAARDRIAIRGGSAGGLLVGAVVTMRPDLFRAVIADVPFVDVINTMLDASIPLTTQEWLQWGDPRDPAAYAYMRSYSPYDNVRRTAYPAMLVTAGLNDPRVGYWEPAKWVARLRAHKTDANPLLLHTNMGAGHGGSSGRYDALREMAMRYAFALDQLGVTSDRAVTP